MKNDKLPVNHRRMLREWMEPFSPIINDKSFRKMLTAMDDFFRHSSQQLFPVDISETETEYIIRAKLPPTRQEDIEIRCYGNYVKIGVLHQEELEESNDVTKYYRKHSTVQRTERMLQLPTPIDQKAIKTSYSQHILEIRAPKK